MVTADAVFTHADVCEKVLQRQGNYILYAKDNQTQLQADLAAVFTAAEGGDFSPGTPEPVGRRYPDRHVAG